MWVDDPWEDTVDGRWSNAWYLFKQALACTLRGHVLTLYEPDFDGDDRWRTCHRCNRRWTWSAAPPPPRDRGTVEEAV